MEKILARSGFRWAAVTILFGAYILVSQGYISGQGIWFNGLNSLGSILLIVNSLAMKPRDYAVAVFNMVWLVIAIATVTSQLI